jgi:hypothetical protein
VEYAQALLENLKTMLVSSPWWWASAAFAIVGAGRLVAGLDSSDLWTSALVPAIGVWLAYRLGHRRVAATTFAMAVLIVFAVWGSWRDAARWLPDTPGLVIDGDGSSASIVGRWTPRSAYRTWGVAQLANSSATFALEVDSVAGLVGWAWYTHGDLVSVEPLPANASPFRARMAFADHDDPYAYVRYDRYSLGQSDPRFGVEVELRGHDESRTCGVVVLVDAAGEILASERACVGADLPPAKVELRAERPDGTPGDWIDVVINDFDGTRLEVTTPTLTDGGVAYSMAQESASAGPVPILPAPQGLSVSLADADGTLLARQRVDPRAGSLRVVLDETWSIAPVGTVRTIVDAEPQTSVAISAARWIGVRGAALPVPPPGRARLGFDHPNLAGHTWAMVFLAWLFWQHNAVARIPRGFNRRRAAFWQVIMLIVAFSAVISTGSRAALAGLVVGWVLLGVGTLHRQKVAATYWLIGVLIAFGLALVGVSIVSAQRDLDQDAVSRSAIWFAAVGEILRDPWGLTKESLIVNDEVLGHAHNTVLEFARAYGIPGGLAVVVFIGIALSQALKKGLAATSVTLVALFLAAVDNTLFFIGVLGPLIVVTALDSRSPSAALTRNANRRRVRSLTSTADDLM